LNFENKIKKILAIDDIDDNLIVLKALIAEAFPMIKFISASSGDEGLALCHREMPDVVLLDIVMPGLDGYEVCKALKSDNLLKFIPVVMITAAKTGRQSRIKALESGADAFLTKPVDESELTAQIRAMLRIKEAEDKMHDEKQQLEELVAQRTEALEKELKQHQTTEEVLRKSESLLRTIIENAPFEIWTRDKNGVGTLENKHLVEHFGSIIGKKPDDSKLSPEVIRLWKSNNKRVFDGEILNDECTYSVKGSVRNFQQILAPIIIDGSVEGIAGFNIDITARKQVEEKVKQNEKLYRTLVETSPDGIGMVDMKCNIITVNQKVCQIFGFQDEAELISARPNFLSFIAPSDLAAASEDIRLRLKDKELVNQEYMAIRKDGTEFPIEIKSSIVSDNQNLPYAFIIIIRNITRRKKIEETQHFLLSAGWTNSGEDFFLSLSRFLANSLDICYVSVDRLLADGLMAQTLSVYSDGRFPDNVTYSLNGTPYGEVVGKSICYFERNIRKLFPQDAVIHEIGAECYVGITLWNSAGKPIGLISLMSRQPFENRSIVESVLHLVAIRAAGELERRDTELELLKSRKAFQNYFNNCSVGMSVTSSEKKWLEVNQSLCRMLGYSKEELGKMTWVDLTYPEDIEKNQDFFIEMTTGKLDQYELDKRFIKKDGSLLYITLSAVCERNPDGSLHHLLASYIDITERKLTEEALKASEVLYRNLVEKLPDGVYKSTHEGTFVSVNPAMVTMLGYDSRDELMAIDIKKELYFDPEDRIRLVSKFVEDKFDVYKMRKKDDSEIWVEDHSWFNTDENGTILFHEGIIRDVSDRKRVEDQLRSLSMAVDQNPVSIVITDTLGHIEYVNPKFSELTGYSPSEVLGKSPGILKSGATTPAEYAEMWKTILSGGEWQGEFINKKKSGEQYFENALISPIKDERGQITHFLAVKEDITGRKKDEIQIRKLSKAIEQSPVSTIITDAGGKIEFVNKAFTTLTQYALDEVVNRPPRIFNHGHTPDADYDLIWQNLREGKVWKGEFLNRRKDRSVYWEDVTISSLMNSEGEISNYILIMDDISGKKIMLDDLIVAKETAEESNRLKSAFLATMNHELRTPLNHILGFSELIMSGVVPEDNVSFASSIQSSGQSLLSIIEGVFELAMVEQANIKLRNQTFSLMDHFMENKASFDNILRTSTKHEQIRLIFKPDTRWLSGYLTADRSKINQVLTNLFKNAVKFTQNGTIEFGYKIENESRLMFYVKDTGIGIPTDKQSIIFDFFRQGDDSSTRVYGGIGIGLAISQKITKILKGELKVVSEPGMGSTFSLTIPVELSEKQ
jgi:PAS domain S-box-containing protein